MEFSDQLKSTIEDLKIKAEKLRIQLNLGSMEARDEFEHQKKRMQDWIRDNDISVESLKNLSAHQAEELQIKFEELQLQLALGRAESEEMLRDQAKNIHSSIHEMQVKLAQDENYKNLKKESIDALDDINDTFFILKTKFDHEIDEQKEEWDEKKERIN
ncbi:MAG: hypothetical protein ABFR62_10910, partial [Bacteroidota bacterium]